MNTTRLTGLCLGITLLVVGASCLAVAAGAGAAGGYAAGKYQVRAEVRGSYESVWDTALQTLRRQGTNITTDTRKGILKGNVGNSQVQIRLKKKNPTFTQVRIRAWKDVLPNEQLAFRLLKEINENL